MYLISFWVDDNIILLPWGDGGGGGVLPYIGSMGLGCSNLDLEKGIRITDFILESWYMQFLTNYEINLLS